MLNSKKFVKKGITNGKLGIPFLKADKFQDKGIQWSAAEKKLMGIKKGSKKGIELSERELGWLKDTKPNKKGTWGVQSLTNLKRRATTKKKISSKLRKYKRAGIEHKRIK